MVVALTGLPFEPVDGSTVGKRASECASIETWQALGSQEKVGVAHLRSGNQKMVSFFV